MGSVDPCRQWRPNGRLWRSRADALPQPARQPCFGCGPFANGASPTTWAPQQVVASLCRTKLGSELGSAAAASLPGRSPLPAGRPLVLPMEAEGCHDAVHDQTCLGVELLTFADKTGVVLAGSCAEPSHQVRHGVAKHMFWGTQALHNMTWPSMAFDLSLIHI